eukprot:884274-Pelagomonas_calceolata.AAC.3
MLLPAPPRGVLGMDASRVRCLAAAANCWGWCMGGEGWACALRARRAEVAAAADMPPWEAWEAPLPGYRHTGP